MRRRAGGRTQDAKSSAANDGAEGLSWRLGGTERGGAQDFHAVDVDVLARDVLERLLQLDVLVAAPGQGQVLQLLLVLFQHAAQLRAPLAPPDGLHELVPYVRAHVPEQEIVDDLGGIVGIHVGRGEGVFDVSLLPPPLDAERREVLGQVVHLLHLARLVGAQLVGDAQRREALRGLLIYLFVVITVVFRVLALAVVVPHAAVQHGEPHGRGLHRRALERHGGAPSGRPRHARAGRRLNVAAGAAAPGQHEQPIGQQNGSREVLRVLPPSVAQRVLAASAPPEQHARGGVGRRGALRAGPVAGGAAASVECRKENRRSPSREQRPSRPIRSEVETRFRIASLTRSRFPFSSIFSDFHFHFPPATPVLLLT
eukprot:scaffold1366_cov233-Pinguiococcus_pyrenoidosus.AAC.1